MTSIEYLQKEYNENKGFLGSSSFEQAKEMHKQEIIDAVSFGDCRGRITTYLTEEEYYQETFGIKGSGDHISDIGKMVELPQQETLYTEEQVIEAIFLSRQFDSGWTYNEDEIIKSLKRAKKD